MLNSRLPDFDQLWILRFPKIREAVIVSADGLNSDDSETVINTFSGTANWNLEITEKKKKCLWEVKEAFPSPLYETLVLYVPT